MNCGRNTMLKLLSSSLTALNTSKLRSTELGSDFRCVATEIGMLSSEFFEN